MNVYLDNSATTAPAAEVCESMHQFELQNYGNPSSPHRFGQQAKIALEEARDILAVQLSCQPREITFTSGGTESNNLAIIGAARANSRKGRHIITSATEHPSVLETARYLARNGFDVDYLSPGKDGFIQPGTLKKHLRSDTILVSLMHVNNETGIINPLAEISGLCRDQNIILHCDMVQSFGKIPVSLQQLPVDLASFSAHKIHGPKGCGALFTRSGTALDGLAFGGGQEAGRRPGTENLAGIVGFGRAVSLLNDNFNRVSEMQAYFENELEKRFDFCRITGRSSERSPFISNIAFPGLSNESLLYNLDMAGIAVAVGSACSSGSIKQSHVLQAMNLEPGLIGSALRFSYSRYTTRDELDYTINQLEIIFKRLKK